MGNGELLQYTILLPNSRQKIPLLNVKIMVNFFIYIFFHFVIYPFLLENGHILLTKAVFHIKTSLNFLKSTLTI